MSERILLCSARGRAGDWEAICLDLDIAVQGRSFDEVRDMLDLAIVDYLDAAAREAPAVRERLTNRRAPLAVRARYVLSFLWHALRGRGSDDGRYEHSFVMPCRA